MPLIIYIHHCDLDSSVFVSLFRELFCFDNVLYSLSYAGSRDLVRQWPAVHNQNKQIFLNETFKTRWCTLLHLSEHLFTCNTLSAGSELSTLALSVSTSTSMSPRLPSSSLLPSDTLSLIKSIITKLGALRPVQTTLSYRPTDRIAQGGVFRNVFFSHFNATPPSPTSL